MGVSERASLRLRQVAGIVTFLLFGCGVAVQSATRQPQPLSHVGRVLLGLPQLDADRIIIPVSFEGGEWAKNSALVPCGVQTEVVERSIFITVVTAVSTGDARLSHITVPSLAAGSYSVIYRDPDGRLHEVGPIEVPGTR